MDAKKEAYEALHQLIKELALNEETKNNPKMIRALAELVRAGNY